MGRAARRTGRWLLIGAFLLALGFTSFHLVRVVSDAIYWNEHKDERIEGWMTAGFIAHSYHVPPHVLLMAIGLPPGPPPDNRPLAVIARNQGRSVAELRAVLQNAIIHARPPYPPPPPPPPHKAAP
ncbi:hypothetical protein [Sphingomonas oryzagri]|uniref:Uncharacterized protein n=1 Tax=Sphingomonas oryzagri TaxID=3042314 RepID=A0ABT6N2R9_9SPHN|nr:hypothetical protein [Sphingomonas oryzagri]MDH7639373.1 hypothetical protein [Sphingomonas oryzagri]